MTIESIGASALSVHDFKSITVRVVEIDGFAWFVANDVAKALEYRAASDMTRILDDDERGTHIVRTPSGDQEMAIINESGLYHALIKSRKPEAVPFRKWITSEVLPAIRKTGSYTRPPQYAIKALSSKKALPGGLTLEQQDAVKALVRSRVEALPKDRQGGAAITCWSALKTKFGCTYKAIPPDLFAEALSLIARLDLLGLPALPAPESFEPPRYNFPISDWHPETRIGDTGWFTLREWDRLREPGSPISRLLRELERDGNDVSLLRLEHSGLCHLVETLRGQLQAIRVITDRMDGNGLYVALRQAA